MLRADVVLVVGSERLHSRLSAELRGKKGGCRSGDVGLGGEGGALVHWCRVGGAGSRWRWGIAWRGWGT